MKTDGRGLNTHVVRMSLWGKLCNRLAPRCELAACRHNRTLWARFQGRSGTVLFEGSRYCFEGCLERALARALERACTAPQPAEVTHRIPLGLLLLSRQQLTAKQLQTALAAQRTAGRGRIGEWLQILGFATEHQVTAALARQWSCPILRADYVDTNSTRVPALPVSLQRWLFMLSVDFVPSSGTLHLAFGQGLDHRVQFAIERMLDCRTEACLVPPSQLRRHFENLSQPRGPDEVQFERLTDIAEFARIISSYALILTACEIRVVICGPHLWVRLLRPQRQPWDLLVREIGPMPWSNVLPQNGTAAIAG